MTTQTLFCDELQTGQGGVWAYVSPSRLGKWLTCPLAFRLQYLEGLRQPTTPSLFLGKVVHAGLERSIVTATWASRWSRPTCAAACWKRGGRRSTPRT